jgi:hypothetical protein
MNNKKYKTNKSISSKRKFLFQSEYISSGSNCSVKFNDDDNDDCNKEEAIGFMNNVELSSNNRRNGKFSNKVKTVLRSPKFHLVLVILVK